MSDAKSSKTGAKHKRKKKPSNHPTIEQIVGGGGGKGGLTTDGAVKKGTCFAAGTLVHTPGGLRPIEQIRPGDLVESFDVRSGCRAAQPVVLAETRRSSGLGSLSIDGAPPLEVTSDHYFWVDGPGWVRAEDLRLGDRLLCPDGGCRSVLAAHRVYNDAQDVIVYNLALAETDTYFVGTTPVLVHSCEYMAFSARPRSAMPL
jgi:hypothetical protein